MSTQCIPRGLFRRATNHHYEARFDRVLPPGFGLKNMGGERVTAVLSLIETMKDETYVCSVCRYCGHVIERKP